jgi:hypothetical protein
MDKTLLLDVMLDGRFKCQLKYEKPAFPLILDGEVVESYDASDLREFVERERPSLKGKDFKIEFATQKV